MEGVIHVKWREYTFESLNEMAEVLSGPWRGMHREMEEPHWGLISALRINMLDISAQLITLQCC